MISWLKLFQGAGCSLCCCVTALYHAEICRQNNKITTTHSKINTSKTVSTKYNNQNYTPQSPITKSRLKLIELHQMGHTPHVCLIFALFPEKFVKISVLLTNNRDKNIASLVEVLTIMNEEYYWTVVLDCICFSQVDSINCKLSEGMLTKLCCCCQWRQVPGSRLMLTGHVED